MIEMNEWRLDFELLQRFTRDGEESAFADQGVAVRADDSLPAWLYTAALLEFKPWLRGEMRVVAAKPPPNWADAESNRGQFRVMRDSYLRNTRRSFATFSRQKELKNSFRISK